MLNLFLAPVITVLQQFYEDEGREILNVSCNASLSESLYLSTVITPVQSKQSTLKYDNFATKLPL